MTSWASISAYDICNSILLFSRPLQKTHEGRFKDTRRTKVHGTNHFITYVFRLNGDPIEVQNAQKKMDLVAEQWHLRLTGLIKVGVRGLENTPSIIDRAHKMGEKAIRMFNKKHVTLLNLLITWKVIYFLMKMLCIHTQTAKSARAFWCKRLLILPTVFTRKLANILLFLVVGINADLAPLQYAN